MFAGPHMMTQRLSLASRMWRMLTRALDTPSPPKTLATTKALSAVPARPEEGANDDYESFCRVRLGDKFDDERYMALRKLGYGQYATVWLARDSR